MDVFIDLSRVESGAEAARELLSELRSRYDLSRWEYSDRVRIAPFEIPHSHPILTLNSQYAIGPGKDEHLFLATYLHEQMHWALDDHRKHETDAVIEKLKACYPGFHEDVPSTAKDEYSTYLHIVVNWLEYSILVELVGEEAATIAISRYRHYTKIYQVVLKDFSEIKQVLKESGILPLPHPQ